MCGHVLRPRTHLGLWEKCFVQVQPRGKHPRKQPAMSAAFWDVAVHGIHPSALQDAVTLDGMHRFSLCWVLANPPSHSTCYIRCLQAFVCQQIASGCHMYMHTTGHHASLALPAICHTAAQPDM